MANEPRLNRYLMRTLGMALAFLVAGCAVLAAILNKVSLAECLAIVIACLAAGAALHQSMTASDAEWQANRANALAESANKMAAESNKHANRANLLSIEANAIARQANEAPNRQLMLNAAEKVYPAVRNALRDIEGERFKEAQDALIASEEPLSLLPKGLRLLVRETLDLASRMRRLAMTSDHYERIGDSDKGVKSYNQMCRLHEARRELAERVTTAFDTFIQSTQGQIDGASSVSDNENT